MSPQKPRSTKRIELCGVAVEVNSEYPDFSRYLERHFPTLGAGAPAGNPNGSLSHSSPGGERPAPTGHPEIVSLVRWTEGPRPEFDAASTFPDWPAGERIDRYIHCGSGGLLWLRVDDVPQIAIASRCQGSQRHVELRYHFSLGAGRIMEPLKRLARWRWLPAKRRHRFSTIVYYAVYYPVWWHLECRGAAHPLHAGAVALGGKAVLIAGLPGSGKSTLAASLLDLPGAELLSDNIIVHDGRQVWGCYEPLLLGQEEAITRSPGLRQTGHSHAFDRRAYHAPHLRRSFDPAAVVVIGRGDRTELEPIDRTLCTRILLGINEAAKEMRRYHVFSAVFGLAEPQAPECYRQRADRLEQLLARVPCFRLHLREGSPAEGAGELIKLCRNGLEAVR